jgi:hypothetical protein
MSLTLSRRKLLIGASSALAATVPGGLTGGAFAAQLRLGLARFADVAGHGGGLARA